MTSRAGHCQACGSVEHDPERLGPRCGEGYACCSAPVELLAESSGWSWVRRRGGFASWPAVPWGCEGGGHRRASYAQVRTKLQLTGCARGCLSEGLAWSRSFLCGLLSRSKRPPVRRAFAVPGRYWPYQHYVSVRRNRLRSLPLLRLSGLTRDEERTNGRTSVGTSWRRVAGG